MSAWPQTVQINNKIKAKLPARGHVPRNEPVAVMVMKKTNETNFHVFK